MHISNIEITLIKVRGNNVDFWTIEITSKKVRGNHVDFSTIEITSKRYVEMTWKFVEIWSSTYRRNIHVESTWIRRGVPVGQQLLTEAVCFQFYCQSRIILLLSYLFLFLEVLIHLGFSYLSDPGLAPFHNLKFVSMLSKPNKTELSKHY